MRCARKPTSVKQPKWHSLSTSSTACWCWDARATSASHETTRIRDHCVHRLIHATRSLVVVMAAAPSLRLELHKTLVPAQHRDIPPGCDVPDPGLSPARSRSPGAPSPHP